MEGSIQKKGSIYYAVVALGHRKRKWFRGGTAKKDAQRVLTEKLSELNDGTYKEIPKTTLSEFADLWIKSYVEGNLKPSTIRGYKDMVGRLKESYGDYKLQSITAGHLQKYAAERLQVVGPKTVCNAVVVIKDMFKHALEWGYIKGNPGQFLKRPRVPKHELEILNPDEIDVLLEALEQKRSHYRVAFLTDFLTGLRSGELWALSWDDIDWNSKQIVVRRSLWKGKFQTPKTAYSIRKVDIPDELVHELRLWKLACPVNEHDVVFPSPEGKLSIHENVVKRYFNPALEKAKLRRVSFHSIRHSNASMRIRNGQNIKYIQQQLGHSSIKVTLDIYGHLFNDTSFARQQVELLTLSLKKLHERA
jgi:integrase